MVEHEKKMMMVLKMPNDAILQHTGERNSSSSIILQVKAAYVQ
jgi:hypothetical protein